MGEQDGLLNDFLIELAVRGIETTVAAASTGR